MSDPFDPYLEWLNIPAGPRPPDHYALLGLKRFESDLGVISQAADNQLARVRDVRPGEKVRDWGLLLDEIEEVKSCLLDPERKKVYDAETGGPPAVVPDTPDTQRDKVVAESPTSLAGPKPAIAAAPTVAMPPGSTPVERTPEQEPASASSPAPAGPKPSIAVPPTLAAAPATPPSTVPDVATPPTLASTPALAMPPGSAPAETVADVPAGATPTLAAPPGSVPAETVADVPAGATPAAPAETPTLAAPPGSVPAETTADAPAGATPAAPAATPTLAAPPGSVPAETTADAPAGATPAASAATPDITTPPGPAPGDTGGDKTVHDAGLDLAHMNASSPAATTQESPAPDGLLMGDPLGGEGSGSAGAEPEPGRLLVARPLDSASEAEEMAAEITAGAGGIMSIPNPPEAPLGGPILPMPNGVAPEFLVSTQPVPEDLPTGSVRKSLIRWMAAGALVMMIVVLSGVVAEKLNPSVSEEIAANSKDSPAKPDGIDASAPKGPSPPPLDPLPPPLVDPLPMGPSSPTIDPSSPTIDPSPPLDPSPPEQPSQPPGPPPLTTDSPPPMLDPSLPTPSLPTLDPGTAPKPPAGPNETDPPSGPLVSPPSPELDPATGLPIGQTPGPDPVPPTPPPPGPPPQGGIDAEKQATFRKAVAGAREAMANRDLAGIGAHIRTASFRMQTEEDRTELARLKIMHHNINEFWDGIREGVAELNNVGDMPFGDTRIAIVEASADHIVFRAYGRNKRYRTMDLPYPLVLVIADRWFSKKAPSTNALIGTFLAVDPRGDKVRAKQLWQQATRDGIDCERLMPELEIAAQRQELP